MSNNEVMLTKYAKITLTKNVYYWAHGANCARPTLQHITYSRVFGKTAFQNVPT